ncbi:MAG: glycosyltransferase family 9 protein [Desulfobacterales bacterium]|nr:glycosyltransferase family 9 protein [Desulfobacterales bacterium]
MKKHGQKAKVLIIHQGALGDFVATFPVLALLRNHFRFIDALCQNQLGKLACYLKVTDRHFSIDSAIFSTLYSDHVDQQVADLFRPYDEIIVFSFSDKLERTIQNITGQKVQRIPPRAKADEKVHIQRHLLSHITKSRLVGHRTGKKYASLLRFNPDGRCDLERVIIHPGSGSKKKCWPLANFIQVEQDLKSIGMKPEFLLGPAEYFLKNRLDNADGRLVQVVSDLCQVADLLKTAGGFIGNDSGISHLAGFLNIPAAVVFGPSDPVRWKPAGQAVSVLRPELDCQPCFETDPGHDCRTLECLHGTTPDRVIREFLKMHARLRAPGKCFS